MPRIRLIAVDIDGTLLRTDNTLSPANLAAVRKAQASGIPVTLATGKPPWAMVWLAEEMGLHGPQVTANGAGIWTPGQGTEIISRLDWEDVHTALAYARDNTLPRALSGTHGVFCEPGWAPEGVEEALREVGEEPPTIVPDACEAEPDPWKVITIARRGQPLPPAPALRTAHWVRTGSAFFEAIPSGSSKATGVEEVCRRLGIAREAVAAIGDSENDLPLLRWAGVGIAMAHAPAEVRQAADVLTTTNNEDGVAKAIEKLLAGA